MEERKLDSSRVALQYAATVHTNLGGLMKLALLCAAFIAAIGAFSIGPNWAQAEEGSSKDGDKPALVTKAIESLEAAIKYLETSSDDFDGQKPAVLVDSKKAVEQLKKVEKPKKSGCRPGSLMLMGVGC